VCTHNRLKASGIFAPWMQPKVESNLPDNRLQGRISFAMKICASHSHRWSIATYAFSTISHLWGKKHITMNISERLEQMNHITELNWSVV
jgi:hypothetical protein